MRFILDADIPRSFFDQLKSRCHDVVDSRNLPNNPLADKDIYNIAVKEKRILITRDLGFSNILLYPPQSAHGIVVLRTHRLSPEKVFEIIKQLLNQSSEDDLNGTLVIVQADRFRFYR